MKKLIFSAMALCLVFIACEKEEITNDASLDTIVENSETVNTRLRDADVDYDELVNEISASFELFTGDNNHFTASLSGDSELRIVWEPADLIEDDIPGAYIGSNRDIAKMWAMIFVMSGDCVGIGYNGSTWFVSPC